MRKIVLHTAKAIANDPEQPNVPVYNHAGTELAVPSDGVTLKQARAWLKTGAAAWVGEADTTEDSEEEETVETAEGTGEADA